MDLRFSGGVVVEMQHDLALPSSSDHVKPGTHLLVSTRDSLIRERNILREFTCPYDHGYFMWSMEKHATRPL